MGTRLGPRHVGMRLGSSKHWEELSAHQVDADELRAVLRDHNDPHIRDERAPADDRGRVIGNSF